MNFGDRLHDGESESGTAGGAGPGLIEPGEPVKDAVPLAGRHPRTIVIDDEGNPTGDMQIPLAYLESLFGKKVHEVLALLIDEREKNRNGQKSELMDLLIAYRWAEMLGGFDTDPRTLERVKS